MGQIMMICLKDHVSFCEKKTPTFGTLKLGPAPYRVKTKFVKIVGLQKNKLGHTVSTQKLIIQMEPSGWRYGQKRDMVF